MEVSLKWNALLPVTVVGVSPMIKFGDYELIRKNEFHITFVTFATQTELRKNGIDMTDVGQYISKYLLMNFKRINLSFSDDESVILRKEYPQFNSFEVSVIQKLVKQPWMDTLIEELSQEFGVVFPKLYPHVTTHSLNGRGIAISSEVELNQCKIGELIQSELAITL